MLLALARPSPLDAHAFFFPAVSGPGRPLARQGRPDQSPELAEWQWGRVKARRELEMSGGKKRPAGNDEHVDDGRCVPCDDPTGQDGGEGGTTTGSGDKCTVCGRRAARKRESVRQ